MGRHEAGLGCVLEPRGWLNRGWSRLLKLGGGCGQAWRVTPKLRWMAAGQRLGLAGVSGCGVDALDRVEPGFWAAPMQGEFIVVLDCDMGELGFVKERGVWPSTPSQPAAARASDV